MFRGWQVAVVLVGFILSVVVDKIGDSMEKNFEGISILIAAASIAGAIYIGLNWSKIFVTPTKPELDETEESISK